MWNGKLKAVTFSFDDGMVQDKRIIDLFNKYGIKATFNINSAKFGFFDDYEMYGKKYHRQILNVEDFKERYKGFEIASHTLTHRNLTELNDSSVTWQVATDLKLLGELVGYDIVGLAYPCGGINNDERVANVIKNTTNVKYCRTITSTHNYDLQDNLYQFNPTVYWCEKELYELIENFINLKTDKPQLLYIWGHGYEIDDTRVDLNKLEPYLKRLSEQEDIFFGTNSEVLLDVENYKNSK